MPAPVSASQGRPLVGSCRRSAMATACVTPGCDRLAFSGHRHCCSRCGPGSHHHKRSCWARQQVPAQAAAPPAATLIRVAKTTLDTLAQQCQPGWAIRPYNHHNQPYKGPFLGFIRYNSPSWNTLQVPTPPEKLHLDIPEPFKAQTLKSLRLSLNPKSLYPKSQNPKTLNPKP